MKPSICLKKRSGFIFKASLQDEKGTYRKTFRVIKTLCMWPNAALQDDAKLTRSVKGTAPQEEWHDTCIHTYTVRTNTLPLLPSLPLMTHPTQGQWVRQREIAGGERGDRWGQYEGRCNTGEEEVWFTGKTYGMRHFLTDLSFQRSPNRICVHHWFLKVIPSRRAILIPTSATWRRFHRRCCLFSFKALVLSSAPSPTSSASSWALLQSAPLLLCAHLTVSAREIPNFLCFSRPVSLCITVQRPNSYLTPNPTVSNVFILWCECIWGGRSTPEEPGMLSQEVITVHWRRYTIELVVLLRIRENCWGYICIADCCKARR